MATMYKKYHIQTVFNNRAVGAKRSNLVAQDETIFIDAEKDKKDILLEWLESNYYKVAKKPKFQTIYRDLKSGESLEAGFYLPCRLMFPDTKSDNVPMYVTIEELV